MGFAVLMVEFMASPMSSALCHSELSPQTCGEGSARSLSMRHKGFCEHRLGPCGANITEIPLPPPHYQE